MNTTDITELAAWLRKRTVAVPIDEDGDNLDEVWDSYELKHRVEKLRGQYVSEADVVAAAGAAGLPVVPAYVGRACPAFVGIKRDGPFGELTDVFGDEVSA
jgi:hypothetical protein